MATESVSDVGEATSDGRQVRGVLVGVSVQCSAVQCSAVQCSAVPLNPS